MSFQFLQIPKLKGPYTGALIVRRMLQRRQKLEQRRRKLSVNVALTRGRLWPIRSLMRTLQWKHQHWHDTAGERRHLCSPLLHAELLERRVFYYRRGVAPM